MEINEEVAEIVKHVQADTQCDSKGIVEIQKAVAEVGLEIHLACTSISKPSSFRLKKKEIIWVFFLRKN